MARRSALVCKPIHQGKPATLFLLLLCLLLPLQIHAAFVTVPIELNYPLLRKLLNKQLSDTPDGRVKVLSDQSGCSRTVLSNPRLSEKHSKLEIMTDVEAQLGMSNPDGCIKFPKWRGSAGFIGRPFIGRDATSLHFELIESWLTTANGNNITSGRILDLAKSRIHPVINRFTLDLSPSINALGMVLPDMLPQRPKQQLERIVGSLKLSDIQVTPAGVVVSLSFQVEEMKAQRQREPVLSNEELQKLEMRWQMMDALFTYAIKYYATTTADPVLRATLLEILLDSRYRLRDALAVPAGPSGDPVRRWFLGSWKRLSPVIRRIGLEQTGQDPLLWIGLLTATDALYALDRLGPAVGLDISADGLRRLARLINAKEEVDALRYDEAVDPLLQRLFQWPVPPNSDRSSRLRFAPWPIRSAHAKTATERLNRWAPSKDQLGEYLPLIADLLKNSVQQRLKKDKLEPPIAELFRKLVLTTAWQESCWRQYVKNKKKIKPLRSGTGDVGLMQINEKIWRGFYDIQKLRWDISYNGRAGTEVLFNYMVKYALKKGEHKRPGGLDNLARASYSAYNGGPGQVFRYRNSNVAATHKKVDTAFWRKYQLVKAGREMKVAQCLGGETITSVNNLPATTMAAETQSNKPRQTHTGPLPKDGSERWVMAQQDKRYTLQLGVFSKRESARRFITQQSLPGQIGIHPVRKGPATQFAVLYGSYANRSEADKAKQRLKRLKPWVRRFADVRKAGRS